MHGSFKQGCQGLTWHPRISFGWQPAWMLVFRYRSKVPLFLNTSGFRYIRAVHFPWLSSLSGTRQRALFLFITVEKSFFLLMCSNFLISTGPLSHQNPCSTLITHWCSRMLALMLIILQQWYTGAKAPTLLMSTASWLSKGNWLQLKKRKNDSFSLPDILSWWLNEVYKIK